MDSGQSDPRRRNCRGAGGPSRLLGLDRPDLRRRADYRQARAEPRRRCRPDPPPRRGGTGSWLHIGALGAGPDSRRGHRLGRGHPRAAPRLARSVRRRGRLRARHRAPARARPVAHSPRTRLPRAQPEPDLLRNGRDGDADCDRGVARRRLLRARRGLLQGGRSPRASAACPSGLCGLGSGSRTCSCSFAIATGHCEPRWSPRRSWRRG